MRIAVNADLCSGQGRCYVLAPNVYTGDDDGYCAERGTEFEVPEGMQAEARLGADACPEGAIKILED